MTKHVGIALCAAATFYFFVWFDIDYGWSTDEYLGFGALAVGICLLVWDYLDRDAQRHAVEREQAWKDGTP